MAARRGTGTDAAQAVERVLRAERDADAALVRTRAEAQALLEAAREDARADVNRALQRVTRWQQAHAQALDARLVALRTRDAQDAATQPAPDDAAIAAAVERVVDRLVGAPATTSGGGPRGRPD